MTREERLHREARELHSRLVDLYVIHPRDWRNPRLNRETLRLNRICERAYRRLMRRYRAWSAAIVQSCGSLS